MKTSFENSFVHCIDKLEDKLESAKNSLPLNFNYKLNTCSHLHNIQKMEKS